MVSSVVERVDREFRRHIAAESRKSPEELASAPDFEEEPIPLGPWLRDSRFLGLPPFSEPQFDVLLHAERILFEPTFEALGWLDVRAVNDLRLAWGKGSGKDYIARVMLSRAVYLLLCLTSPQAYFGMPGTESIHLTNVATAAPQAKLIFFDPWARMLRGSPWFSDRCELLTSRVTFDKGILAVSGHSKVESQEGQNLLMAIIDEISGFRTAQELAKTKKLQDREPEQSAQGIFRTLQSSIRSRFPLTGKLVSLSFTRFRNDMIDQLVKKGEVAIAAAQAEGRESTLYVSRRATWEVNPLRKRSDFDEDYATDPLEARGRYECKPEASPYRFFQNLLAVRRAMGAPLSGDVEKIPPEARVGIRYWYGPDSQDPEGRENWQVEFDLAALPRHNQPLAIHMDLGISQDLCGVAASHVSGLAEHVETVTSPTGLVTADRSHRPQVECDFVIAFEQQPGDPTRDVPATDIQVRWVRLLIAALRGAGMNVGMFTADGYQSTDMLQTMTAEGVQAELYSLDRKTEGYDVLKNLVYSGDLRIPFDPDLYGELESLVKVSDSKIDHQAGMGKDRADALAGSVRGALVYFAEHGSLGGDVWSGGSVDDLTAATAPVSVRQDPGPPLVATDIGDGDFWSG